MKPAPNPHYRHRFPTEIISHAVWLYHVFSLSLRDVELLLAERGVVVSYETIRRWCKKFGQSFAAGLRRRRTRPGDKWYLDEVFIRIQGVQYYLWRAVDQDGVCYLGTPAPSWPDVVDAAGGESAPGGAAGSLADDAGRDQLPQQTKGRLRRDR
jgi:hypothetical protein